MWSYVRKSNMPARFLPRFIKRLSQSGARTNLEEIETPPKYAFGGLDLWEIIAKKKGTANYTLLGEPKLFYDHPIYKVAFLFRTPENRNSVVSMFEGKKLLLAYGGACKAGWEDSTPDGPHDSQPAIPAFQQAPRILLPITHKSQAYLTLSEYQNEAHLHVSPAIRTV